MEHFSVFEIFAGRNLPMNRVEIREIPSPLFFSSLFTLINAETACPAVRTIAHPNCRRDPVSYTPSPLNSAFRKPPNSKRSLHNKLRVVGQPRRAEWIHANFSFPSPLLLASFRGGWGNIRLIFVSVSPLFFTLRAGVILTFRLGDPMTEIYSGGPSCSTLRHCWAV